MKTRRAFLSDLAVGLGCLCFRFRSEAATELAASRVIASGQWGDLDYTINSAWKPVLHHDSIPILYRRCDGALWMRTK